MKFPCTLAIMLLVLPITVDANTIKLTTSISTVAEISDKWDTVTDELIQDRLENIALPFEVNYTPNVRKYIKRYVALGPRESEAMLGRAGLYFPIFEHYLSLYGLPQELKFLPMVESTLRPGVKSHAGAAGLWQMIPVSARHFGLTIDGAVDQRLDPNQSTEAAVKMLSSLYKQFGNWALVMAAYNCGAGRVRKAIRYAQCDDYWAISKYLPKETQRYVPSFVAAAYLVNYYDSHGLTPKYPVYDLQETRTFVTYTSLRLTTIAKQTNVSISILRKLNPGYLGNIIPASRKGQFLVLPAYAAESFRAYLNEKVANVNYRLPEGMIRTTYATVPGDRIEALALLFRCSVEDIMNWNLLKTKDLAVGQSLVLYLRKTNATVRP